MLQTDDVVIKLKEKDEKAFELVFRKYYPELCGFALKYVQNQDVAEELVQELFCTLWKKLDNLVINTSLKSYLYSAVRNAAFNYFKHQEVTNRYTAYQLERGETHTHENTMEVKELQSQIDKAVQSLPEKCREVFRLSRFEHKKYKEIAEELNISIKTVENQMGKALSVMRKELGSYLPLAVLVGLEFLKNQ